MELQPRHWMRIKDAARYSNTSDSFVRKLIHTGRLRVIFVGRYYVIDREDLDKCLEKMKTPAKKKK
jgi:excisionase family DNA binding protein